MPKKASAKGPGDREILKAAAQLFITNGYSRTQMSDIASSARINEKSLSTRYDNKEDIVMQIFRSGRREMEAVAQRKTAGGSIDDNLSSLFEGLIAYTEPWGVKGYLTILLQATKDKRLREIIKQASEQASLSVKFYLNDMIDRGLINEKLKLEAVSSEMMAIFVEQASKVMNGKSIEVIKRAWIEDAKGILSKESSLNAEGKEAA